MPVKSKINFFLAFILIFSNVALVRSPLGGFAATAAIKPSYQITAYNLEITTNLKDQTVDIICELDIKPFADLKYIHLFADPVFKLRNVQDQPEFKQDKDLWTIPVLAKKDKPFKMKMNYVGRLTGNEYPGRAWNYVGSDGIYLFQWWYPVTFFTISAGYSEVVTMNIKATLQLEWSVASPDVTYVETTKDKTQNIIEMQARDPAFFYHFIAGKYQVAEVADPKKIVSKSTFYGAKEKITRGKEIATRVFDLLAYYEATFGTPAPKNYLVIQMPDKFRTILAERASLFIPTAGIDKPKEEDQKKIKDKDKKLVDIVDLEFISDKVAASWWGGTVYGIGPEAEFLNTSLASYSGLLYQAKMGGEVKLIEGLRKNRQEFFDKVKPADEKPLSSVVEEDKLDLYFKKKGPLVYHMLRQVIGDAAFFKALRNFAGRFAGKFATIQDLSDEVSKASGKKLGWFFEQWVEQVGRLSYNIDFTLLPGENPFKYKIRLEPFGNFKMPFRINVIMVDRSIESFEWDLNDPDKEKVFSSKKRPVGAKINNPEGYLLSDDSVVNSLLKGPIKNFFYLDNFIIAEGTWQGNEVQEKAARDRTAFYKNLFKKTFNIDVPTVKDKDLTDLDLKNYNLILVGCNGCNSILAYWENQEPFWGVVRFDKGSKPLIDGPEREGAFIFPNPSNSWNLVLADEFFNSNDNYDTHNLDVDFFGRSLKRGDTVKGYFNKLQRPWKPVQLPYIQIPDIKDARLEMFENTYTIKGSSAVDFYLTYNFANKTVFGIDVQREFVPAGNFEKKLTLLRGKDFAKESVTLDAKTPYATYQRVFKVDFRGELVPPVVKFKTDKRSFKAGSDIVLDWEATDNETFESDIQFSWSIDGGKRTPFAKGKRTTLKGLPVGKHSFKLYAQDQRGNLNYTLPPFTFTVVK